jgi:hypothetical protein
VKAFVQKGIDQPGRATANIDNRGAWFRARCPNEVKGDDGTLLKPAQFVLCLALINMFPMILFGRGHGLPHLSPKIALPTLTWVAPSWMASSKSALMPMESTAIPLRAAIRFSSAKCGEA